MGRKPNLEFEKLNSFGFDMFAGKEVCEGGLESLVILDFTENDVAYYNSAVEWVGDICSHVRSGDRILFTKSPGKVERKITSSYDDAKDLVSMLAHEAPEFTFSVNEKEMGRLKSYRNVHPAREYLPLPAKKLSELRNILDIVIPYSRPFDNQP